MTIHYSYHQIADSFELWQEYVQPHDANREDFDAMSHAERVALQVAAFGPEEAGSDA